MNQNFWLLCNFLILIFMENLNFPQFSLIIFFIMVNEKGAHGMVQPEYLRKEWEAI